MEKIELDEKKKKHHKRKKKHFTSGVRYGFFPRLGIYACNSCGHHHPIGSCGSSCPSCGSSSDPAPVNTGDASPPAPG